MLTDCAVLRSASPICSAMLMKRLLNTSSSAGSGPCVERAANPRETRLGAIRFITR